MGYKITEEIPQKPFYAALATGIQYFLNLKTMKPDSQCFFPNYIIAKYFNHHPP